jgi:hypothetical protein
LLPLCDRIFDKQKLLELSAEFKNIQDLNVGSLKHLEYYKLLSMLHVENDMESEKVYY